MEDKSDARPIRILIVEDEILVAADIQNMVESLGYEVAGRATTGEDALAKVAADDPDLVFMDIRLQGRLDGVEAAGRIRSSFHKPVIFLTALSDDRTIQRAKMTEPFGYLFKPFDARELRAVVEMTIHKHRLEAALLTSETRFRELFNHMTSAVAIYVAADGGADFFFKDFNPAGERMELIRREALIGRSVLEVFPGIREFGLFDVFQRVWRTGVPEHFPVTLYRDARIGGWRQNYVAKLPSGEIVVVYDDVTEKKRAEEDMLRSREELRRLALHLETARENERTRIAQELHDEFGQALTAVKMDLTWLAQRIAPDETLLRDKMLSTSGLVDGLIGMVQRISMDLRPGLLDDLGLVPALRWQAEDFQERMGIPVTFFSALDRIALDDRSAVAVYRIFQEALTNVARHAHATAVAARIEREGDGLRITISDDGQGIPDGALTDPNSLGLIGMRERAATLQGSLEIQAGESGRGLPPPRPPASAGAGRVSSRGTRIVLRVPPQRQDP